MNAQGKHTAPRHVQKRRLRPVHRGVAIVGAGAVVITSAFFGVIGATSTELPTYAPVRDVVADDFGREASDAWGAAETGGDYALSSPQNFAVDGNAGLAELPRSGSSLTASLDGVSVRDVLSSTTVAVPELPTAGNGVYAGIQSRVSATSYYLVSVRVAPGGRAFLTALRVVGSTAKQVDLVRDVPVATGLVEGDALHLDVEVTGTTDVQVRARAYTGDTAPDWQLTTNDTSDARLEKAGAVALWAYVSSKSEPVDVAFDSVSATELERLEEPPAPEPTDTSAPPVDPDDPDDPQDPETPDGRGEPGAATIGTTEYPVPADALFAESAGSVAGKGSKASPFASLTAAIAAAPSGATIVLREGEYHGSFVIPRGKRLTIQSYPGEAVWLDGSREVAGWEKDGSRWRLDDWTVRFDASPTYSRGARDGTAPGWQFVNPDYPMAAHPDQVWIDGEPLDQVASAGKLTKGTFYVSDDADRLYLGSDPKGKEVRAADTVKALVIAGAGSTVRGIGIRNYSPSVPDMGAVAVSANNVTIENVAIVDAATTGLATFASNTTLRNVTIDGAGMLGAQASTADGLKASELRIVNNNAEHFNRAPVAGGFKIHKSRGVAVTDSSFVGNLGNGLWFDESVYNMKIAGNDIVGSTGNGLVVELSATALVADNIITDSGKDGILVSDSGHIDIWNNTIARNDRSINIVQGDRRAADLSLPGHDRRQKLPDPTVTWITEDISIGNNILAEGFGKCVLCVEDYSHERSAAQMQISSDGNVFQRISAKEPTWAVVWSRGKGNPQTFNSIAEFSKATGRDSDSLALDAEPALDGTALAPAVRSVESAIARPLPSHVAAGVQRPTGVRHLGAWD